jgi:hypothetical protein
MPQVLAVPTFKVGHPVHCLILVISDYFLIHVHAVCLIDLAADTVSIPARS